jgi:hypothetical protein
MQIRLEYADSTAETIATDATWQATTGPLVFDGVRNGEVYDARIQTRPYSWMAAEVVPCPKGILKAETMPPNKVMETIKPVKLTEPKPGVFVFDLGQNIAGWAFLNDIHAPVGKTITMRYGERIGPDGMLERKTIDTFIQQGPFQTDTYITRGMKWGIGDRTGRDFDKDVEVGPESYEPRFTYHGFRWVEVTGWPRRPTLDNLRGRVVHTAFTPAGSFQCSNELLNTIQRLTLWSYRSNFVGYPTDCPQREKNGWTGDAQLAGLQGRATAHRGTAGDRPHIGLGLPMGQRSGLGQRLRAHPLVSLRVSRRYPGARRALRPDEALCRLPHQSREERDCGHRIGRLGAGKGGDAGSRHVDRLLLRRCPDRLQGGEALGQNG